MNRDDDVLRYLDAQRDEILCQVIECFTKDSRRGRAC